MHRAAILDRPNADFLPPFVAPQALAPRVARLLIERYGENARPSKSLDARQALLRRLRLAHYDWNAVTAADRLDVVWVLWEGPTPPAEHERFLLGFLAWIEKSQRRLQATRLASAWTDAFDPALNSIRVVADWLARHVAWLPAPWPSLAAEFQIFSLEQGPRTLAETFLAGAEAARPFFDQLRLPVGTASSGLGLEILVAAAALVAPRLAREPRLAARLCTLALDENTFRPQAIAARVPQRAGPIRRALAEALLLPWLRTNPAPALRSRILAFLLRHYGDPRVERAHWTDIQAAAAAIMRRWLTEQTVTNYFQLAAQMKSADRAQIAERREFWMQRLDRIDDAWLLSGSGGAALLGPGQPAHGTLGGSRADQSSLLLRVGGVTVLESSHEAHESIWLPGNAQAPVLFRRADQPYWSAALAKSPDFSSAFNQKNNDTWQERLARFIDKRGSRDIAA
jgi:hypothetical protein